MNWRRIDNMLVLWSIQQIQRQINNGTLDPPIFSTAGQYNAWRFRMEDRLMAVAHKNGWLQDDSTDTVGYDPKEDVVNLYDPSTELNDDVGYYRKK